MCDLQPNAPEDKDVAPVCDSPGRTQEPLQSHTSSLKNNAAGLSSDEHENPLNGTQPNPFVYSSVPAVPHAGNSLPSGALVNGPGSHPSSEVHCVLNKGSVLSNNVLDAAWRAEKDTSPEVLPPPSELQSDAWKNTAGPVVKTPATQPGVNTPPPHSEQNESKLARSTLSAADRAEQMHISQPLTKQTMKTRSRRDAEQSSSDDYDDDAAAEAIRWDSERECFRRLETQVMHQRDRKHNPHVKSMSGAPRKVNHTCTRFCSGSGNDVDIGNKEDSLGTQSDIKYSVVPLKDLSRNTELHIYSSAAAAEQRGCNEGNDPEDEDNSSSKVEQEVEQDPLFFSCTICNVNFKERRHFHRHMMYHLGKHNQVNSEPFICRECGRLFCDSSSLMRHIIIHRDRLQKLMEEIKGLRNTEREGGGAAELGPLCGFGRKRPKISVQHARTHDNLKHYYFCEECNYITLTQPALEAHLQAAHRPRSRKQTDGVQLQREAGSRSELRSCCSSKKAADQPGSTPGARPPGSNTEHVYIQESIDKTVKAPRFKCRIGCTDNMLPPSLWRVDRHGKLLLQAAERLDVATDLTCVEGDAANNDCEAFGSSKQANCPATAHFLLSARNLKLEQMFCQGSKKDPVSGCLQANRNPLSTPLHNTIDNMNGNISAALRQRLKQQRAEEELEEGCEGSRNRSDDTSEAAGSFLESEDVRKPFARRCFRRRPSRPAKDQSPDGEEDCSDIEQLVIKEEHTEAAVCDAAPESPRVSAGSSSSDVFPAPGVELRPCPYCPAMFESGVGLSNHVRGHLHRVGLSYNARHMVSPEQVALRDHQPRVRRRIVACGPRRARKAVKPESRGEHMCPLCWFWFDTKTGLSNHVRGHLKRIGSSSSVSSSSSKSPLCILNELLRDKRDRQNLLNQSRHVLMHMDIPVKIQYETRSPRPVLDRLVPKQEAEVFSERTELRGDARRGSGSSLVELLKMRRERLELTERNEQEVCDESNDYTEETSSVEPGWAQGECDSGKICIQCDDTFPRLPGHLRAYAHRKRIAIFEGDDYKQKKLRPRPGLKKKVLPSLDAEIYTLTCRFCDLVFQGPLSIQEDWIRHLQRHLLHTSVPRSGSAMVEVLGLHHKIHMRPSLTICHGGPMVGSQCMLIMAVGIKGGAPLWRRLH